MLGWRLSIQTVEVRLSGAVGGFHQPPDRVMLQRLVRREWSMCRELLRSHGGEGVCRRVRRLGTSSGGPGVTAVILSAHQYVAPFVHGLCWRLPTREVGGGENGPWVVARGRPQNHSWVNWRVQEPTVAGANVRILREELGGVHGQGSMEGGLFTTAEQRWLILGGWVFCVTFPEADAVFSFL